MSRKMRLLCKLCRRTQFFGIILQNMCRLKSINRDNVLPTSKVQKEMFLAWFNNPVQPVIQWMQWVPMGNKQNVQCPWNKHVPGQKHDDAMKGELLGLGGQWQHYEAGADHRPTQHKACFHWLKGKDVRVLHIAQWPWQCSLRQYTREKPTRGRDSQGRDWTFTSHMPNVYRKLRNGRHLALLACAPWVRDLGYCKGSTYVVKLQPSSKIHALRAMRCRASYSLTKTTRSASSVWLKKASGCQTPETRCSNMAPMRLWLTRSLLKETGGPAGWH